MTMSKMMEMAMAQESIKEGLRTGQLKPCGCIGPQNGQPLCPCAMKSLVVKDGRYIQVIDYGPAPKHQYRYMCTKCGYVGPDAIHQRPSGSGECGYMAPMVNGDAR